MSVRPIFVVAGVGKGFGTGAAAARAFSKAGYRIALIARNTESLKSLADEIKSNGGDAAPFAIPSYQPSDIQSAFRSIKTQWPSSPLRVALWNTSQGIWKPFLEITPEEVQESVNINIVAAFAFAREVITAFKELDVDAAAGKGKRGTLIFTGATASLRGNVTTSAFAAGKHGLRALSQSLAKEFGKQNIHVAHAIIDGNILTDRSRTYLSDEKQNNPDQRLDPESIASSYVYLANQDRSAWTWELDLRPAHETW